MRFEWDDRKARRNVAKHGVTFAQAVTAFDGPFRLIWPDAKHSTPVEWREWLIGRSEQQAILMVVFTRRAGGATRIISARRASRNERRKYETAEREDQGISLSPGQEGDPGRGGGSTESH